MNKEERQRYQKFLAALDKFYYDENQITWFNDLAKKIEEFFGAKCYKAEFLFESRMKDKEKFIVKFHKSLTNHKINPHTDIFGIRITANFVGPSTVAAALIDRVGDIIPPEILAHARIKKIGICDQGLLVGTFISISFRDLPLEIQLMRPEIREYVNQTHAEYDYQKYGILPEENQPQIKL